MSNWDTEETERVIANDEELYVYCDELAKNSSTSALSDILETEVAPIIDGIEYCKVDTDLVDWLAVAVYIMDETEG